VGPCVLASNMLNGKGRPGDNTQPISEESKTDNPPVSFEVEDTEVISEVLVQWRRSARDKRTREQVEGSGDGSPRRKARIA